MRRWGAFFLVVGLFASLMCSQARAENESICLSLSDITASVGGSAIMPMDVTDPTSILAVEVDISYPTDTVGVTSVTKTDYSMNMSLAVNTKTPGLLKIAMATGEALTTGGTLFNINFSIKGLPGETAAIEVTRILINDVAPACVSNGSIEIAGIKPRADAGPDQTKNEGDTVTLNGANSSDEDGDIVAYSWQQTSGQPQVELSDPDTVAPTFIAPNTGKAGTALTFQLKVTDNHGLISDPDDCIVNVTWVPIPPTVDVQCPGTVSEEAVATLSATTSCDPESTITAYSWKQTDGPLVQLSAPNQLTTTFKAPNVGSSGASLTFELTVTDSNGLKARDTCIVTVTGDWDPPVADAGLDQVVSEAQTVTLDGSQSYDPDDVIDAYLWTQTSGTPVTFSNPSTAVTTFKAPTINQTSEDLKFELTVTDHQGLKSKDSCTVTVQKGTGSLTVTLQPQQAIDAGAKWSVDNGSTWRSSGERVQLASGTYTVKYKQVSNWSAPSDESISLASGDNKSIARAYTTDPPVAAFSATPTNGPAPLDVSFTNESTGNITQYQWEFGDGSTSLSQNPVHTYRRTGAFDVTLRVSGPGGYDEEVKAGYVVVISSRPTVSIRATDKSASETGGNTGTFTVERTGNISSSINVKYKISGKATNGKDYKKLSGTVKLAPGQASASILVKPIDDRLKEGSETVIASLITNSAYMVGSPAKATVTILDNDKKIAGSSESEGEDEE